MLERVAELRPRRQEAQALVDGLGVLDVAGRVALLDLLLDDGPEPVAREREHGHGGREREPAERHQATAHRLERVLVHLAVTDEAPRGAAGEERQHYQERHGSPHGARSSMMMAG